MGNHNIGYIRNGEELMFIESETPILEEKRFEEIVLTKDKVKHNSHSDLDLTDEHCYPVVVKRLKIDLNLKAGSNESWEFHKNLVNFYDT